MSRMSARPLGPRRGGALAADGALDLTVGADVDTPAGQVEALDLVAAGPAGLAVATEHGVAIRATGMAAGS